MGKSIARRNEAISDHLHPIVYLAITGLALWLVLSVWVLFDSAPYAGLIDTVVTGFLLIAVAIPLVLWRVWRRHGAVEDIYHAPRLRDWAAGEFDTSTGKLRAWDAGMQILLPIAAVAFGMTAFGIVLYLTLGAAS
jgi:hypothetical protein